MKEIEELVKLGLFIKETGTVGPYANGYFIGKLSSNPETEKDYIGVTSNGERLKVVEYGHLYFKDRFWIFEVWEYVPGPGSEDFICKFEELPLAINAVVNFFFGKPTIVNDWIFPLHKHPELQTNLIDLVIKNAVKITKDDFDKIVSKYREAFLDNWEYHSWDMALKTSFLRIFSSFDRSVVLMVRRDLKESYLICD